MWQDSYKLTLKRTRRFDKSCSRRCRPTKTKKVASSPNLVVGDEYDPSFKEKYILIIKKVYFLTRLLYSLSPAAKEDSSQIDKAKSLLKNLKGLRDEIKGWLEPLVEQKKAEFEKAKSAHLEHRYRRHLDATSRLHRMIDAVDSRVRKL